MQSQTLSAALVPRASGVFGTAQTCHEGGTASTSHFAAGGAESVACHVLVSSPIGSCCQQVALGNERCHACKGWGGAGDAQTHSHHCNCAGSGFAGFLAASPCSCNTSFSYSTGCALGAHVHTASVVAICICMVAQRSACAIAADCNHVESRIVCSPQRHMPMSSAVSLAYAYTAFSLPQQACQVPQFLLHFCCTAVGA